MHVWPPRSLLGFHSVDLHDGFLPYRNTGTAARQWMGRIDDYLPYLQGAVGADATINDLGLGCNSWAARPWAGPAGPPHQLDGDAVGRFFCAGATPQKPFFLWTSFCGAPPAPGPPAPIFELYDRRAGAPPWGTGPCGRTRQPNTADGFTAALSGPQVHAMQAGYYRLITHLDHQVGRLIRELKDEGVLNDTVVLFTSDHGEMLGDHCMLRKEPAL